MRGRPKSSNWWDGEHERCAFWVLEWPPSQHRGTPPHITIPNPYSHTPCRLCQTAKSTLRAIRRYWRSRMSLAEVPKGVLVEVPWNFPTEGPWGAVEISKGGVLDRRCWKSLLPMYKPNLFRCFPSTLINIIVICTTIQGFNKQSRPWCRYDLHRHSNQLKSKCHYATSHFCCFLSFFKRNCWRWWFQSLFHQIEIILVSI